MKSYRTKEVLKLLKGLDPQNDITQNQLIHWAETSVVKPSVQDADGHGSYREYALKDLVKAAITSRLLSVGLSLRDVKRYFDAFESASYFRRSGKEYVDLWDALRNDPENYRYFFEITYGGRDRLVVGESGFCADIVLEFLGRERQEAYRGSVMMSGRFINICEIVDSLRERTGESL